MKREVERLLLDNGFRFVKGNKHELWSNGTYTFAVSQGNNVAPRTYKAMLSKLNRIRKNLPITQERYIKYDKSLRHEEGSQYNKGIKTYTNLSR